MIRLLKLIDQLIPERRLPWALDGQTVHVKLVQNGRGQTVHLGREEEMYVFSSVILGSREVTRSAKRWRALALWAWRRNAEKDLVAFLFDVRDRLIGRIEQPVATADAEEVELYIATLARECDRFEYLVTGGDSE